MTIGLEHYLTVAAALFVIGIFGIFLNRKNIIIILMSLELMLLSVNIYLVAFSSFLGDLTGQVFTLFILTVAAAEAAMSIEHDEFEVALVAVSPFDWAEFLRDFQNDTGSRAP